MLKQNLAQKDTAATIGWTGVKTVMSWLEQIPGPWSVLCTAAHTLPRTRMSKKNWLSWCADTGGEDYGTCGQDGVCGSDKLPEDFEPYATNTPLTHVYGDHVRTRVVAAMLGEPTQELSIEDVAQLAGSDPERVKPELEKIEELGVVSSRKTEECGRVFTLVEEDELTEELYATEWKAMPRAHEYH